VETQDTVGTWYVTKNAPVKLKKFQTERNTPGVSLEWVSS